MGMIFETLRKIIEILRGLFSKPSEKVFIEEHRVLMKLIEGREAPRDNKNEKGAKRPEKKVLGSKIVISNGF